MKFRIIFASIILVLIPVSIFAASLSPSVMEVSVQRGETIKQKLTVINTKTIEQTYYLDVIKFEPSGVGGTPSFIPFEEDHSGLADWIGLAFSEFVVPANSKYEIPFTISIPSEALSGGYYAAITVSQAPSDLVADNGAMVEAKTAALILLTVEGETNEKLVLLDFSKKSEWPHSRIDGLYEFRLQNQGNVHVTPTGIIKLKDFFGRTVDEFDANPSVGRVLPNSTRQFLVGSETPKNFFESAKDQMRLFAIGPMTAELSLKYGQSEQTITSNFDFWYVPWQIMVVDVVLVVAILLIYSLARKRK
ncbi:hypothetical protein HY771_01500 [Candidatus Uhrbacteria bacterium]|nr:hypothetical protein [Candidatus Uhrbacteria bacterium]